MMDYSFTVEYEKLLNARCNMKFGTNPYLIFK